MGVWVPPGVLGGAIAKKSVEYLTLTFAAADTVKTVNLTKSQIYTQCVPFHSVRISTTLATFDQGGIAEIGVTVEIYNNAGTAAVRATRGQANKAFVCHIFVVEFNAGVSVIQGTLAGLNVDGTVAISAVTLAKTFLVFSCTGDSGGSISDDPNDMWVRGRFNSTTQLGFNRNNDLAAPAGTLAVRYYLVQDIAGDLFDVQTAEASMGAGVTTVNTGITSVDMTKSMVVASADGASNLQGLNSEGYAYLQAANNVRFVRTNSTSNTDLHTAFVVTFKDGTTVQRGIRSTNTGTAGDADRSETVAITTVDTLKSIAKWSMSRSVRGGRNVAYNGANNHSIELTAGGASITIRYRGGAVASEVEAAWEVITFAG